MEIIENVEHIRYDTDEWEVLDKLFIEFPETKIPFNTNLVSKYNYFFVKDFSGIIHLYRFLKNE